MADAILEKQKTGFKVNLPANLANTAFERKVGTVARDLSHLSSSFTRIRTALTDAENSATVYGWDERSTRKAKLIVDKLNEQTDAFKMTGTALQDAILRARGKNPPPRASPRQSPRNPPIGAPPALSRPGST
jgi:hypothetical protein